MPRRKTTRRRRLDKVMDYNPGNSFRNIDKKKHRRFQYVYIKMGLLMGDDIGSGSVSDCRLRSDSGHR